jgi:hypothetical protein
MSILTLQAEQQPLHIQTAVKQFQAVAVALLEASPGLSMALAELHKNMIEHEEIVQLLDDDDIQKLHKAHEAHKQVTMITITQKEEKTSINKAIKNLPKGGL